MPATETDETATGTVYVRHVPADLKQRLRTLARSRAMTDNALALQALRLGLDALEKDKK